MNQIKVLSIFALLTLMQGCSTHKNKILWVSGIKTECSTDTGTMQCLNIHKGETLDNTNWDNFYAQIEGFEFVEGYLQKIEVTETKPKDKKTQRDGSSPNYRLVKVLNKQKDTRTLLNGNWTLAKLRGSPLNRMVVVPKITIDLSKKSLYANGGCNNYTGQILLLTSSKLSIATMAGTKKACINKNVESEFQEAMNSIATYQVNNDILTFYDKNGKRILDFIKGQSSTPSSRLHDIWLAIRIDKNPINRMNPIPRMEINLTNMKVMGYDGCNNYTGEIKELTDTLITFGTLASTEKMCRKMDTANSFGKAMDQVTYYKLDGLNLILLNEEKREVLAFLKGD